MILFGQSLAETILWCTPRIDLEDLKWSLRSEELRPQKVDFLSENDPGFFNSSIHVADVVQRRAQILKTRNYDSPILSGRLLLSDFGNSNFNCATQLESKGFFDWADNPPWDLWVGLYHGRLLVWIPNDLIEIVERSMLVECMQIFRWINIVEIGLRTPVM